MTVSIDQARQSYSGTSANTPLPTVFEFFDDTDLRVIQRTVATGVDLELTQGTHYSVSGGNGEPGTVTPLDGIDDFQMGVHEWTIIREVPRLQGLDYVPQDRFPAASHEEGLDRAALRDQDLNDKLRRTLRFPDGDPATLTALLPSSVARANKYQTYDSQGQPTVADAPNISGTTVLATGTTTARMLQDRFADIYNILDFGAVGNGVTDDTAAIAAALAVVNGTGAELYFPPGDYLITDGLQAFGCTLRGCYNSDSVKNGTTQGSIFYITGTTNPAFKIGRGTTVIGLQFYYPNQVLTNPPTTYPATLQWDSTLDFPNGSAVNVSILECVFVNPFHAVDVGNSFQGLGHIVGNRFYSLNKGITVTASAEFLHIAKNQWTPTAWHAVAGAADEDVQDYVALNAVCIELAQSDGTVIEGNSAFGFGEFLRITGTAEFRMYGNIIDAVRKGISVTSTGNVPNCEVVGNRFTPQNWKDSTDLTCRGIDIADDVGTIQYLMIAGNVFTSTRGHHIQVVDGGTPSDVQLVVVGNRFDGAGLGDATTTEWASLQVNHGACDLTVTGNAFMDSASRNHNLGIAGVLVRELVASGNQFRRMKVSITGTFTGAVIVGNRAWQTPGTSTTAVAITAVTVGDMSSNVWDKEATTHPMSAVRSFTSANSLPATGRVALCDATGGAFTLTLPDATAVQKGYRYSVKRLNAGGNNVTVGTVSAQTIDGITSQVLTTQYQSIEVVSDGSNWHILT